MCNNDQLISILHVKNTARWHRNMNATFFQQHFRFASASYFDSNCPKLASRCTTFCLQTEEKVSGLAPVVFDLGISWSGGENDSVKQKAILSDSNSLYADQLRWHRYRSIPPPSPQVRKTYCWRPTSDMHLWLNAFVRIVWCVEDRLCNVWFVWYCPLLIMRLVDCCYGCCWKLRVFPGHQ